MIFLGVLPVQTAPRKRKGNNEEDSRNGKVNCDVAPGHYPTAHAEETRRECISQPGKRP
jgi:hypothetical protein